MRILVTSYIIETKIKLLPVLSKYMHCYFLDVHMRISVTSYNIETEIKLLVI
jgi:hypothetical protein